MKRLFTGGLLPLSLFLLFSLQLWGQQIPQGYYTTAEGKKKAELKTALHYIIKNANVLGYGSGAGKTWSGFAKTDVDENGKYVDMYSPNKVPVNGSSAGSGMNIEHSFAKSWWGGDRNQAYCDIQQLRPSNSGANSSKGSWPMAVVDGKKTYDNEVIKVGKSGSRPGGEITAWEPSDEYKGDFARIYMYMVTCYEDYASKWTGNSANQLDNNTYPVFEPWTVELLLKWCRQDPVSDWEIKRNDKVYDIQGNRNPYVDYPELAEYVWGDKTGTSWFPGGSSDPVINSPKNLSVIDMGMTAVNKTLVNDVLLSARNLAENVSVTIQGAGFTVTPSVVTKEEAHAGKTLKVTWQSGTAVTGTAVLAIKSGLLTTTVTLKAEAVDGIPALPAASVTTTSFAARWIDLQGGLYNLNVYESDGTTSLNGYPVSVPASAGEHTVTDLQPGTDYYYLLSQGSMLSNKVKVTTMVPTPLLSFTLPDGDLDFTAVPGEAAATKRVIIQTENLKNNIQTTVDQPFEISLDQENWSSELVVGKQGETLYVRMPVSADPERYEGTLTFSADDFAEPHELDITGTVESPSAFFEDFENGEKGSYGFGNVTCSMCEWTFDDAGLFGQSSFDRYNEKQAVRLGKTPSSYICMNQDKPKGIGRLSFLAARSGSDPTGELQVAYSVDGGVTWLNVGNSVQVTETTLKKYSFELNVEAAARIKIQQTKGARLNIDDVEMTDYVSVSIKDESQAALAVRSQKGVLVLNSGMNRSLSVLTVDGMVIYRGTIAPGETVISLPAGNYIISADGEQLKAVVY